MATTINRLKNETFSRLAWSVVIEGLYDAYTTLTAAQAATVFATTEWSAAAQWHTGLKLVGSIGQEIKLFDPRIEVDSLDIQIVDVDNTVRTSLLRINSTAAFKTFVTVNLPAAAADGTGVVTVLDTTDFAATGTLFCGTEAMTYTGKTATTFTGVTRAKYTAWTVSGGGRFSRPHRVNANNDAQPIISTAARSHYGRTVWVYLHHFEESGVGAGDYLTAWVGRIHSIRDDRGMITLRCRGYADVLQQDVMSEQFTAKLAGGIDFTSDMIGVHATESVVLPATFKELKTTLGGSGTRRTPSEVAFYVNAALDAFNSDAIFDWSLVQNADGLYQFVAAPVGTAPASTCYLSLSLPVWMLLGFEAVSSGWADSVTVDGTTYALVRRGSFVLNGDGKFVLVAEYPPLVAYMPDFDGSALTLEATTKGTWVTQTHLPVLFDQVLPSSVSGFLQIGDWAILAVTRTDDVTYVVRANVTEKLGGYKIAGGGTAPGIDQSYVLRSGEAATVKQVWIDRDSAKTIFRKILFSTGTTDYNYPTFDRFGVVMGLGIPWSAVDDDSLELLGDDEYGIIVDGPRSFAPLLESLCAVRSLYIVRSSGKIKLRPLRYESANVSGALVFTEGNKAVDDEIIAVDYSPDGIINRIAIKHGVTVFAEPDQTLLIEDVVSAGDFGNRRTASIVVYGLGGTNIEAWAGFTASYVLAYFSREVAIMSRTFNATMFHSLPADTALLTDSHVIDPKLGTRGVTSLPCWVMGVSFDFSTGVGTVRLAALLAEVAPSAWAPSSRVDDTAANGGLDLATLTSFTVYSNKYRDAGIAAGNVVDGLADGDKILIIEWSPSNPAAPLKWSRTIDNMPSNTEIIVTVAIAAPAWDATKKYIITHDVYGTVVATQKNQSFIGDDATDEVTSGNEAYRWGPLAEMPVTLGSIDYTQRFVRTPDTADDAAGANSTHTVHDAAMSANAILAYVTRTSVIQEHVLTTKTVIGTTSTRVYGPVWVPIMSPGRTLLVRVFGRQAGTGKATFDIYSQPKLPTGTADNAVTRSSSVTTVRVTTTSATDSWIPEATLTPHTGSDPSGLGSGCWLWVEAFGETGISAIMQGISVVEDGLT